MKKEIEVRKRIGVNILLVRYIRRVVIAGRVMYQGKTYPVKEDENGLYMERD